jgi:DNA repair exonuclease SbcCD ATPase subunit
MAFQNRAALELEIDASGARVRDLQEQLKSQSGGVTLDDVKAALARLVELRKELQVWDDERTSGSDGSNDENSGVVVNSSPGGKTKSKKSKKKKKSASPSPVQSPKHADVSAAAASAKELESEEIIARRADGVATWLESADERLQELEGQVGKLERTKKAVEFLDSHAVATTTVVKESVAVETASETATPKKSKKKASKAKAAVASESSESTATTTTTATETASSTTTTSSSATVAETKSEVNAEDIEKAVAAAVASLEIALVKEKTTNGELSSANNKLREAERELREAQTKLEQSVAELQTKNGELLAKLNATSASDSKLREEVTKLQRAVQEFEDEKDAKETHLGKLWKSIDEFQVGSCTVVWHSSLGSVSHACVDG